MDGWRCGPEEALQIRLGRWPPEHHPVVVRECQVLALLFSESLGHRIRVLAEHPGDRRGAAGRHCYTGWTVPPYRFSERTMLFAQGVGSTASRMFSTFAWPKPAVPFTPGKELSWLLATCGHTWALRVRMSRGSFGHMRWAPACLSPDAAHKKRPRRTTPRGLYRRSIICPNQATARSQQSPQTSAQSIPFAAGGIWPGGK